MATPGKVQVDSHAYLLGRERPVAAEEKILGREAGDAELLFPRCSQASAAVTGEVAVNGRVLKVWTFQQLEALSRAVLKDRAIAIREVLGEAACPPVPSGQRQDLMHWILHMQTELTKHEPPLGRSRGHGTGHEVPPAFAQDAKERPITMEREPPTSKAGSVPFGTRGGYEHTATRDNFGDLKYQRNDFKEPPVLGIQTLRPGGEGRRHLQASHSMVGCGVSAVEECGIQSLKPNGEGRRYLACEDHLMEQKRASEAADRQGRQPRPSAPGPASPEPGARPPRRHASESHLRTQGVVEEQLAEEPPVGGERRRHVVPQDHMVNHGTSAPDEATDVDARHGRKYLDGFAGPRGKLGDSHGGYQSSWKKDPKKLLGASMRV